jgi:hypothetical protein
LVEAVVLVVTRTGVLVVLVAVVMVVVMVVLDQVI